MWNAKKGQYLTVFPLKSEEDMWEINSRSLQILQRNVWSARETRNEEVSFEEINSSLFILRVWTGTWRMIKPNNVQTDVAWSISLRLQKFLQLSGKRPKLNKHLQRLTFFTCHIMSFYETDRMACHENEVTNGHTPKVLQNSAHTVNSLLNTLKPGLQITVILVIDISTD